MEDLIDAFASSQVTLQQNSTAAEHPRFASLYKSKTSSSDQESRRQKFLEAQKKKRYDYISHARFLATNEWKEEDGKEEEESEGMDVDVIKKPPRSYKDQLMLSEWLVEVPSDLADQWLLVLCPVGKRSFVVASRGSTKVYTKSGYRVNQFQSRLPGGNKNEAVGPMNTYCLLDCIFDQVRETYYILDVMCWNSHPCFDSDTEFRFYWKDSKVLEYPAASKVSSSNPFKFVPLPHYNCDQQSIKDALWSPMPFPSKLDGLLFYHKRTHYISGTTPLVGWLKGYMVPEMLGIEVPGSLAEEKPASYVCMQQHVPEAFAKHAERKEEEGKNMQYEDD